MSILIAVPLIILQLKITIAVLICPNMLTQLVSITETQHIILNRGVLNLALRYSFNEF